MRRWRMWVLVVIGILVIGGGTAGVLWFRSESLATMQKVNNDHVKHLRFTGNDTITYATRENEIKRINLRTGEAEVAASVEGFNVRIDPSGTYASHVKDGRIHITSIDPDRIVRRLDGTIHTWQDESTLMYIESRSGDSIFTEEGRLTRYHFETESRDRIAQIATTDIHPATSYSGFVLTAAGEEVAENARLTLYSDRQDLEVVVSDQPIESTDSNAGVVAFQTRDDPALKLINREGRINKTQLEPAGNMYRPLTDDAIAAELIDDDQRVIALYDITEAVIEARYSLRDVGEVTDIAASDTLIAVTTTDGLYAGEL